MENNNNKCKKMLFDDVKHIKWANNVCELFFTSHTPTAFYVQVACTVKKNEENHCWIILLWYVGSSKYN